jgi:hypothetical protein
MLEFGCQVFVEGRNVTILHQGTKNDEEEESFVSK